MTLIELMATDKCVDGLTAKYSTQKVLAKTQGRKGNAFMAYGHWYLNGVLVNVVADLCVGHSPLQVAIVVADLCVGHG